MMKRGAPKTVLLTLVLLIAFVGAIGVAVSPTAAHAASCSGNSCAGRDPQAKGCTDASNVPGTEVWNTTFSVAMRRSGACSARWTRLIIDDWLPTCCIPITISIESQRYVQGPGWLPKDHYQKTVSAGLNGSFWTPMVADGAEDRFMSCWGLGQSPSHWNCSDWQY